MPSLSSLRDFSRSLEPRAQLTLVLSLLAVAATAFGIYHFASQQSYSTIQTGLSPTSANRVASALSSAGVPYKLENGGTSVAVPEGKVNDAQVALGSAGLSSGGHPDLSQMNTGSLSSTAFQQQVNYQIGLEGQIANTIEGIDGVDSAEVQLVLPKDQLFQDQSSQATAAVMLTAPMGLDASTVRGIAHQVASSVQGLDPQNVTITDQTGALLWPNGDAGGGAGGMPSKLQAEQTYAAQVSSQVDALLTRTLGPGKAEARVNVDLNVDQTETNSTTYDDSQPPIQLQGTKSSEKLKSNGANPSGPAGTPSNIPGYTGGSASNGNSDYSNTQSSTTNGVNTTQTHTVVAPGTINRMDVALMVDQSVPAAQVAALKTAVESMVGLDPSRGDTLNVASLKFASPAAAGGGAKGGPLAVLGGDPFSLVKKIGAAIAVLVLLFLVRRNLKRREDDPVAPEPKWLREIQQTTPLAELSAPAPVNDLVSVRRKEMQATAEEIVRKNPDQVAMQVAQWMSE